MSSIVNSPDVLAAIQQRKRSIKKKLQASKTQMTDNVSCLTGGSMPKTASRLQSISRIVINGLVLYRGYRLCSNVLTSIYSIFSPRKRRR